jgi:hypothetical protein
MDTERAGGRRRRRCGQCCKWMDARAKVCPHCRSRTRRGFKEQSRQEFVRLLFVLALALASPIWRMPFLNLWGWVGGKVGDRLVHDVIQGHQSLHSQPAKPVRSP